MASWQTTYAEILPEEFLHTLDEDVRAAQWARAAEDDSVLLLVAEDENGICGFICGGAIREAFGEFDAELYAIYLRAESQRGGVGRMLTASLVRQLIERGFSKLVIWVLEENPACGFYERLGARLLKKKSIQIAGCELIERAYGLERIEELQL